MYICSGAGNLISPPKTNFSGNPPNPLIPMKFCTKSLCSLQVLMYLHMVLISFICFHSVRVSSTGNETDRLALLHFKESVTSSDPIGILNSWNSSVPHCSWLGVTCNHRHGRVASLILEGQELLGPISPYIGNLSFIRLINLQNNSLHGAIPQQFGKLFRLQHLILDNNKIGCEIPVNLTSCYNLRTMFLGRNNLSGEIPHQIGSLAKLQILGLYVNKLTGLIPSSLANLTSLEKLLLAQNNLLGEIPREMSELKNIYSFSVPVNNLSGVIPPFLFNSSSIKFLSFSANKFHGGLPDKGFNLPNLEKAYLGGNQLSGKIPSSFTNASHMQFFEIAENNFVGSVPSNIGDLSDLRYLNIASNNLGRNSSEDLVFLASLARCLHLEMLDIHSNHLGGVLTGSIANLSTRLNELYVGGNQIFGQIPRGLENLTNLITLNLESNLFTGVIPSGIGKLQKLQELRLHRNMLSGSIPSSIGNLSQLSMLILSFNNLEGSIPSSIGNCQSLNFLVLNSNNLTGHIPEEILNIPSLSIYLGFRYNHLSGSLPQTIGKLTAINELDISHNLLIGEIPASIGGCLGLEELYMQGNLFGGRIPDTMASLKGLVSLDLSQNNLTGNIPKALENLTYLQYLNISFNDLEGELPTGGVFGNASLIFLAGNNRLCGGIPELHLPECPTTSPKKEGKHDILKLPIVISSLLLFAGLVAVLVVIFWKKQLKPKLPSSILGAKPHITVSYKSLVDATSGFSSQNLLGCGSFGSVYKGLLDQLNKPVAIKVLNLQRQGVSKSILAECNALRNIRHRNLIKLVTYCSSLDYKGNEFKALVFEFMPNGSLENWLHPACNTPGRLDILQRLNIVIDVASALHYLHDLCEVPIIHRDLKPSNVLLDDDMVAHVGDFGLAKFLSTSQSSEQGQTSTLGVLGTTGYAAPEYGLGAAASKEGDIYSFGILLLEMFSGRRPTDDMFTDGLNLVDFVKNALPERVMQVVDPVLLATRNVDETDTVSISITPAWKEEYQEIEPAGYRTTTKKKIQQHELSCLLSVMEIGVSCSEESPSRRANLKNVLGKLQRVKDTYLSVQLSECKHGVSYVRRLPK